MLGIVISYSPSFAPTPIKKRTWDSPSMLLATELPRKRDFGRSSPQSSRPCSGEAKYLRRGYHMSVLSPQTTTHDLRRAQHHRNSENGTWGVGGGGGTDQAETGGWCETCSAI